MMAVPPEIDFAPPTMSSPRWLIPSAADLLGGVVALGAALPAVAPAATYGTAEDAARRAFPAANSIKEVLVMPTPAGAALLAAPGLPPRSGPVRTLEARQGEQLLGRVVVDAVIGKFEQIDYAVALAPDQRVVAVDILAYREGHGGEVRLPAWRRQFVGKGPGDPIRLGADIANISGATLSCTHVTEGVHRLVAWAAQAAPAAAAASAASGS
jgi:hypothetical protein